MTIDATAVTSKEDMPMVTTAMAGVTIGLMVTMATGNELIIHPRRSFGHRHPRRALVSFSHRSSFVLKNADSEA
jgi:hypothetical protein